MAAAGAVTLFWPNVPTAAAAEGTFTYTDAAGVSHTSANPPDNYCITLPGSGEIANHTDTPVGFYKTGNCMQKVASVDHGDSGSVPTYGSVMFSENNAPKPTHTKSAPKSQPQKSSLPLGLLGG
jgi:hypothetical protein